MSPSCVNRADCYICHAHRSLPSALTHAATKCVSKNHGYLSTLSGVEQSLAKFGFGASFDQRITLGAWLLNCKCT